MYRVLAWDVGAGKPARSRDSWPRLWDGLPGDGERDGQGSPIADDGEPAASHGRVGNAFLNDDTLPEEAAVTPCCFWR